MAASWGRRSLHFAVYRNLKYTPFRRVNLEKRVVGHRLYSWSNVSQNVLCTGRRKISADKNKNMMDLLPHISSIHHAYFTTLQVETNTRLQVTPLQLKKMMIFCIVINLFRYMSNSRCKYNYLKIVLISINFPSHKVVFFIYKNFQS